MKTRNLFIDAATLLSSLLLVTGFICYRAGMFNRLLAETPQPTAAPSNSEGEILVPLTGHLTGEINATLLPGSKSFDISSPLPTVVGSSRPGEVHRAPSQEGTVAAPQPSVTVIMSGSKSMFVPATPIVPVANQPAPPPATPPAAAPQTAPTTVSPVLLPGSKSAIGFDVLQPRPAPAQQAAPARKP